MKVEIVEARGLQLYINGKAPTTKYWEVGVEYDDHSDVELGWTVSGPDHGPVVVAGFKVIGVRYDIDRGTFQGEFGDPVEPKRVIIKLDDHTEIGLPVKQVAYGDAECGSVEVKLVNGKLMEIDETMVYIFAEG